MLKGNIVHSGNEFKRFLKIEMDNKVLIDIIIKKFSELAGVWEEYIQFLEIKSFIEASNCLRYMYMSITSILTYVDLECTYEKNILFSNIDVVPEIIDIIKKDIDCLADAQIVQDNNDLMDEIFPWDELSDDDFPTAIVRIFFDAIEIRKQLDALGVTISVYLVYLDDKTSMPEKEFAKDMLKIYRQLLYFGKIEKIFFQTGKLTNMGAERNCNDCTTRFQIIFSLYNRDKYIMRVDMSHEGQPYIHINLSESVSNDSVSKIVATAFPFSDNGAVSEQLSFLKDDMINVFYKQGHMYWFRTEFKKKIEKLFKDGPERDILEKLFDDRCHYYELWKNEGLQEKTVLSFLDKQRDYIRIMNLSNFNEIYFVKSDNEIIDALGKLRWIDKFVDIVYELLNIKNKEYCAMSIVEMRKVLWMIFDTVKEHEIMWQGRIITEDSFMQKDLLTVCRWIMEI